LAISSKLVTLKVVTLFKTNHFKSCGSWQILQNQSLVIDYHYSVIDYTSTVVTLHV